MRGTACWSVAFAMVAAASALDFEIDVFSENTCSTWVTSTTGEFGSCVTLTGSSSGRSTEYAALVSQVSSGSSSYLHVQLKQGKNCPNDGTYTTASVVRCGGCNEVSSGMYVQITCWSSGGSGSGSGSSGSGSSGSGSSGSGSNKGGVKFGWAIGLGASAVGAGVLFTGYKVHKRKQNRKPLLVPQRRRRREYDSSA